MTPTSSTDPLTNAAPPDTGGRGQSNADFTKLLHLMFGMASPHRLLSGHQVLPVEKHAAQAADGGNGAAKQEFRHDEDVFAPKSSHMQSSHGGCRFEHASQALSSELKNSPSSHGDGTAGDA